MASQPGEELVQVDYFQGEPLARLAEDRLRREGIDCVLRSAGVGPGGWGTAAGLPFSLWVRAGDEARAREVLGAEATPQVDGGRRRVPSSSRLVLVALLIAALALLLGLADVLFERLF